MESDETQRFEPIDAHAKKGRPMFSAGAKETIQKTLLVFTLAAMGLALVAFLFGLNSIIETWFRPQWVPVARTSLALVVILVCLYVLRLLTGASRARA